MISYERVVVTPALAKKWLQSNAENNRRVRETKVLQYARDMLSGAWNSESGETVKFDESETLIDGQNRLSAVIAAGVPVGLDIARGLPSSAMMVIDSGASRTAGDVLKILGTADRMRTASIVRWVLFWDAKLFTGSGGRIAPTHTEIAERYRGEPGMFDAATRRATDAQRMGLGTGSPVGTAHYLFSRIDQELTHQFFDQYISGANLPDRSAVLVLRNRMARLRADRITRAEQLALFIRAWNAFRDAKPLTQLIIVKGDLTNANFPQPK